MTKVTRAIQAELERRRLAREPCRTIAADYDICEGLVYRRTQHLGVYAAQPERGFDYARAVALAAEHPVRVVAAKLGAKKHTVWRALRVMRRGYA